MGFELCGGSGQCSYFDFLCLAVSLAISSLPLRPQLIQIWEVDRPADTRFLQDGAAFPEAATCFLGNQFHERCAVHALTGRVDVR
jgi:hypothetical protein